MEYNIIINDTTKEDVEKIYFYFENCDVVNVFKSEIVDMKIEFEPTLEKTNSGIMRKIKGGFIKVNLNDKFAKRRDNDIYSKNKRMKKDIIERVVGTGDITEIEIEYEVGGSECIVVPYEEIEDERNGNVLGLLACSTIKLDEDGNLVILMGDKSEFVQDKV